MLYTGRGGTKTKREGAYVVQLAKYGRGKHRPLITQHYSSSLNRAPELQKLLSVSVLYGSSFSRSEKQGCCRYRRGVGKQIYAKVQHSTYTAGEYIFSIYVFVPLFGGRCGRRISELT